MDTLRRLVDEGQPVDVPAFVRTHDAAAAERAFVRILADPAAFVAHAHAVAGLRVVAELGRLDAGSARLLLDRTEPLAQEAGHDEWYKTLDVLAAAGETAQELLPFAARMVERRNVRDWLWLAFVAVEGAMRHALRPAPSLRQSLRREAELERDARRREEMRWMLDRSEE